MAETAPELHTKALLASIDNIGTAARAIDEAAEKLVTVPLAAAPAGPRTPPAPIKK